MTKSPVSPWMKRAFAVTVFGLGLTGLAQMPIFSRYYIADIPGFGWLGDFVFTHTLHYALAAIFLFLAFFFAATFFLNRRPLTTLTASGAIRVALYTALIVTGAVRVVKNISGVYLGETTVMLVDWSHLLVAVLLLLAVSWSRRTARKDFTTS
ncbi:MAG: iron-sulfur cluster-binding protein [Thermodesulfobacteriota bacterium]